MNLAPVALFVYARPDETQKTLIALRENFLASQTSLFIFSDGPKNEIHNESVKSVRKIIKKESKGFAKVEIIEREKNFGLAKSIIQGVTDVLNIFDRIIVLEEDLISSKNFLNFLNQSLIKYRDYKNVFSCTGYTYQIDIPKGYQYDNYFTPRCESLGWGTWKDRWAKFDWEVKDFKDFIKDKSLRKSFEEIGADLLGMLLKQQIGLLDSWAVRWCYTHFKHNAFCSYPTKSKIVHIGEGGLATHVKKENKILFTELDSELKTEFNFSDSVLFNDHIIKQFNQMFRKSLIKKIRTEYYLIKYNLRQ
ncbi:MAG: sugar transferase [Ignavibacterium sp.]|jgi:hypothetical protein|uniref:sugar transferase n=1 Tax=Ignavibacterium sp. TaxID=2651167 RepID=UPI0032987CB1